MKGILLAVVAVILSILLMPLGVLYSMIRLWVKANFKTWFMRINQYFYVVAVSIDQMGNVIMQELFNDILIKKGGSEFGHEDETISSVLGKNKTTNTLRFLGRALNWFLNLFEEDHAVKSIEEDEGF